MQGPSESSKELCSLESSSHSRKIKSWRRRRDSQKGKRVLVNSVRLCYSYALGFLLEVSCYCSSHHIINCYISNYSHHQLVIILSPCHAKPREPPPHQNLKSKNVRRGGEGRSRHLLLPRRH